MSDSDITLQPAEVAGATDLPEQPLPLKREPSQAKRGKQTQRYSNINREDSIFPQCRFFSKTTC